jgi:hypothetical protein
LHIGNPSRDLLCLANQLKIACRPLASLVLAECLDSITTQEDLYDREFALQWVDGSETILIADNDQLDEILNLSRLRNK